MDPSKLTTSMVTFVMKELSSAAIKEVAKIWNVDKELGELLATYRRIEIMLKSISERRWETNDTSLETWLQDLDGYLYDTEDLVDDLILSCPNLNSGEKNPVRSRVSTSIPLKTPHKIVKLREDLDRVSSWIEKALGSSLFKQQIQFPEPPTYKSLLSDKLPFMCGTIRDQDKETIVEKLIKSDRSGVSIVGIDGLGKTSLARSIMNDVAITSHFPLILSASVSGDFRMTDIVHTLVADYLQTNPQAVAANLLEDLLRKERALIILDDLWSATDDNWQRFEFNYLSLSPGTKVLITTPNSEVSEITKSTAHVLRIMTDEDCKKLIMERGSFSQFEGESLAKDVEVIAKMCQGLPVIANKLGLELSRKQSTPEKKERLVELKKCNLWGLQEFRKVLISLNSNELMMPLHLTRCFAYCSLFPSDHEFVKDDLIQLWEVEGFIQPQESLSSKAIARKECFNNILSRCILHPLESTPIEQPIYKVLEIRHKFAELLASKTFCRVDKGTSLSSCQNIRHLSLTNCENIDEVFLKNIEQCKRLRTFLLLHQNSHKPLSISYNFFEKLQSLRLLDLSLTNISTLSKAAFQSKHLRYLDLSSTEVEKLPKQIQCLRALQVLKLKNCQKLLQLPKVLNQLLSLTHLYLSVKKLSCLPSDMGKLTNLEVLDSFLVGKDEGYKVLELMNMKNLTKIHIFGLDNIEIGMKLRKPC